MAKWGLYTVNRCPLCHNDNEDLQHLFFQCNFSSEVWSEAKEMAEINYEERNWQELIRRFVNDCVNKNIGWVVRRLTLAASIYFIWQERNGRIFKDAHSSSKEVYNRIVENVKYKLNGITVKDSLNVRNVEAKWKIKCKRLRSKD
ncbi:reverse transcriptase zinc-binding domain-containing protein [Artemisia annua]|uniref:Reverse transcriptase zinc-binding domain-containing protein n=1 Tax=Artemisia annua TaxID=35608 RepID=A0A2U1L016_ARTAN|nr:reverse transcriptase zinc-binding domain-containing protein [Artemisia annua]PWA66696.1 reverse transcriptase zinc-binding domain-containing protein [Artemisia annua]